MTMFSYVIANNHEMTQSNLSELRLLLEYSWLINSNDNFFTVIANNIWNFWETAKLSAIIY